MNQVAVRTQREHIDLPLSLTVRFPTAEDGAQLLSQDCLAFMRGLLDVRQWNRIGREANEALVFSHPWFAYMDIQAIASGGAKPPLQPNPRAFNFDVSKMCSDFLAEEWGFMDGASSSQPLRSDEQLQFQEYGYCAYENEAGDRCDDASPSDSTNTEAAQSSEAARSVVGATVSSSGGLPRE
jgi:hypothetical protein